LIFKKREKGGVGWIGHRLRMCNGLSWVRKITSGFHKMWGNFLTVLGIIRFSKKTLLHGVR
jgi:hypothetical protein